MLQARFIPTSAEVPNSLELARLAILESRAQATALLTRVRSTAAARIRRLLDKTRRRALIETRANLASEVARQLAQAETIYQNALVQAQADCLKIIGEISRDIIRTELQTNPAAIQNRVESLCATLRLEGGIKIFCNPLHELTLRDNLLIGAATVKSNPELPPGDIVIESAAGSMIFSWEEHLEVILNRMKNKLSSARAPNAAIIAK